MNILWSECHERHVPSVTVRFRVPRGGKGRQVLAQTSNTVDRWLSVCFISNSWIRYGPECDTLFVSPWVSSIVVVVLPVEGPSFLWSVSIWVLSTTHGVPILCLLESPVRRSLDISEGHGRDVTRDFQNILTFVSHPSVRSVRFT